MQQRQFMKLLIVLTTIFAFATFIPFAAANTGDFLFQFGEPAYLVQPGAMDLDTQGNVYVTDGIKHQVVIFSSNGEYLGSFGERADPPGEPGKFVNAPRDIDVTESGDIYVLENYSGSSRIHVFNSDGSLKKYYSLLMNFNSFVIDEINKKIYFVGNSSITQTDLNGNILLTWGELGVDAGQIYYGKEIAIGPDGNLYLIDGSSYISCFSAKGVYLGRYTNGRIASAPRGITFSTSGSTFGHIYLTLLLKSSSGFDPITLLLRDDYSEWLEWGHYGTENNPDQSRLQSPTDVRVDSQGNVYVLDTSQCAIKKYTWDGQFIQKIGNNEWQYRNIKDMAVGPDGKVYVLEDMNLKIYDADGYFLSRINLPYPGNSAVAVNDEGDIFIIKPGTQYNIYKYDSNGIMKKSWGKYDNARTDGTFVNPVDLAVNPQGHILVLDNRRNDIQSFDKDGNFIAKFGSYGTDDGQFRFPSSFSVDGFGNVFVRDDQRGSDGTLNTRIQVFDQDGSFLRLWGSFGTQDGQLEYSGNLSVDMDGNVYDSERYNNFYYSQFWRIQVFDALGTLLHSWGSEASGDEKWQNSSIAADAPGRLVYVYDEYNQSIKVFEGVNTGPTQPVISWEDPSDITYGTPLGVVQLNAVATVGKLEVPGSYVYTPIGGTVLDAGSHVLSVEFIPTDTENYEVVTKTVTINVSKAPTTTAVIASDTVYDGNPHGGTAMVSGPNGLNRVLVVSYTGEGYGPTDTAPTNSGTYVAAASYAGSANYLESNDSEAYEISKATATLSLDGLEYTYDGTAKSAIVTTDPEGLGTVKVTYDGSTAEPTNSGIYAVEATLINTNYRAAPAKRDLVINKASTTTTIIVSNFVYDGNPHGGTAVLNGPGLSQELVVTYVGIDGTGYGPTDIAPTNTGAYSASANYAGNNNYKSSSSSKSYIIAEAETVATVTVSPNPAQYSDPVTLTATITPAEIQGVYPATGEVAFYIDGQLMGTANLNNGVAILSDVLLVDPIPFEISPAGQISLGDHAVRAVFGEKNQNYNISDPTTTLTIHKEDALVTYTGALFVSTGSQDSTTATITLAATIQDITAADPESDPNDGNIRNATITFVDRDAENSPVSQSCENLPIGTISPDNTTIGTVTCMFPVDLSNVESKGYTIGIVVGGYYWRNTGDDDSIVAVSIASDNMITGGGYLLMENSAGLIAASEGTKNNFGFTVKYNKSGKNLQGRINTIVRDNGRVYQIKGNRMTSFAVDDNKGTAIFNGKASIQDITDPLNLIPLDGNATLQVEITDGDVLGTSNDSIAITVWDKSGGLWFANKWNGVKTVEQNLNGGNIVVR